MTDSIEDILELISQKLTAHGFYAMREFSAVDSLIHADQMLGVMSVESSRVAAQALRNTDLSYCIETDHEITVRLFGKSGDFVDYEAFSEGCYALFYDIVSDSGLLVCTMQISRASQSMPLRRLERKLSLTVRVTERSVV